MTNLYVVHVVWQCPTRDRHATTESHQILEGLSSTKLTPWGGAGSPPLFGCTRTLFVRTQTHSPTRLSSLVSLRIEERLVRRSAVLPQ
eukprot:5631557-Pleurochrysis_carterae.AAC.1